MPRTLGMASVKADGQRFILLSKQETIKGVYKTAEGQPPSSPAHFQPLENGDVEYLASSA